VSRDLTSDVFTCFAGHLVSTSCLVAAACVIFHAVPFALRKKLRKQLRALRTFRTLHDGGKRAYISCYAVISRYCCAMSWILRHDMRIVSSVQFLVTRSIVMQCEHLGKLIVLFVATYSWYFCHCTNSSLSLHNRELSLHILCITAQYALLKRTAIQEFPMFQNNHKSWRIQQSV